MNRAPVPITILEQGSFFAGGRTVRASGEFNGVETLATSNDGATFSVEHAYVQYQIPANARSLPLVMIHGAGQTGKTWESTPDGREGLQTLMLRRGWSVYIIDFPNRGRAGTPTFRGVAGMLDGAPFTSSDTLRFGNEEIFVRFRLGPQPGTYFEGSQFPRAGLDQFLRQNIGYFHDDFNVISSAIAAVLERIGPAILVTHSQSGLAGWMVAMVSARVRAIVSYEPGPLGGLPFPVDEMPKPHTITGGASLSHAHPVSDDEFAKLARIPIQIVHGDNIPTVAQPNAYLENWRVRAADVAAFVETLKRRNKEAEFLDLPAVGITGNTHFPFSDLNNVAIADLLGAYLRERGMDG